MDKIDKIVLWVLGVIIGSLLIIAILALIVQSHQKGECEQQGGVIAKVESDDYTANKICIEPPVRIKVK